MHKLKTLVKHIVKGQYNLYDNNLFMTRLYTRDLTIALLKLTLKTFI